MLYTTFIGRLCVFFTYYAVVHAQMAQHGLVVETNTGTFIGLVNGTTPTTRQFRSIPYAQPPQGERRWMPPAKVTTNSSNLIDATHFPPPCAQYGSRIFTEYTKYMLRTKIPIGDQGPIPGTMFRTSSEDCLYLSVNAPLTNATKLPVIVFIPGGGFVLGGSVDIDDWKPSHWVERTKSHIVVTLNYRVGIMGFPNAAGLEDQNLGLLDQRAALEWVYENIESFGGDPEKITLWGQSAGASSVDYHNFAYPKNPIAKGLFMQSGSSVLSWRPVIDENHTNFTFVSKNVGCGDLNATEEINCMRNVSAFDIITFAGAYQDNSTDTNKTQPRIRFNPILDNKLLFSNYTERFATGNYSKLPAIISHTANEYVTLTYGLGIPVQAPGTYALSPELQELVVNYTLNVVVCGNAQATMLRAKDHVPTYRYQYAGNFTNISVRPFYGAFHAADIPIIMGAYYDQPLPSGRLEIATAEAMQDRVLSFMKDPVHGPAKLGWQPDTSGKLLQFGADGKAVREISTTYIADACARRVPWNWHP